MRERRFVVQCDDGFSRNSECLYGGVQGDVVGFDGHGKLSQRMRDDADDYR
jgi:hypothetical protein